MYLLYGHPKCLWQHTLKHPQNANNMAPHTAEDLKNMGVYPIEQKSWYLAHFHGKEVKSTMTESSTAEKRF
eukprot:2491247-Prorocentrum_lima.AAC.1